MAIERNQTALHLSCLSSPLPDSFKVTPRAKAKGWVPPHPKHLVGSVFLQVQTRSIYKETSYQKASIYANLCPDSHILWLCLEYLVYDLACVPGEQLVHFGAFKCVFGRKGPFRALEECQVCQVWMSSLLYSCLLFSPATQGGSAHSTQSLGCGT